MKRTVRLRSAVVRLAVIGAAVTPWSGCADRSEPDPVPIRNVVLISIDPCRADRLSCYGYGRETTPHIDAVARHGVLFRHVVSPVPLTLPAHSSMFTGTNPPYHGVHDNNDYRLAPFNVTLAELLKDRGFVTGAVIGAFVLDAQFGLNQGFAEYHDQFDESSNAVGVAERRAGEVSRYALKFLAEHRDDRFFLFLHYYDPHHDYAPPEPFAAKFSNDKYGGEIAYTDYCIGQVIDQLKKLELYDSTLLIITADHGEMLGEHGERHHGYFIYRSALRVPLIFRIPGQAPRTVEQLVGLIDIVPTMCTLLGIEPPENIQGVDLWPLLSGRSPGIEQRDLYCESLFATKYNANPLLGLITEGWKYIHTTRPELFDLDQDPRESRNVFRERAQMAMNMRDRLAKMIDDQLRDIGDRRKAMDSETTRQLQSLGYVAGESVEEEFSLDPDKDDPKDLVDFHSVRMNLVHLLHTKQYTQAAELCRQMVEQRPQYAMGHYDLGVLAMELKDHAAAAPHLRRAIELKPDYAEAHNNLAILLASQGRHEEAKAHYERALQARPQFAEAYNNLGRLLESRGRRDDAIRHYEQALHHKPDYADAHTNLGGCLLALGRPAEAVKHLGQALRLNADDPRAHKTVASILLSQGQLDAAIEHWRRALRIKPDDAQAHNDLGNALQQRNQLEEAIQHYRRALRTEPDHVQAHNNLGNALQLSGMLGEAIVHYEHVLRLKPDFVETHYNLAMALLVSRRYDDAMNHLVAALQGKPDWVAAMIGQAQILAAHPVADKRRPPEAVRIAERAAQMAPEPNVAVLDTLAVAYAAAGRFDRAVTAATSAANLATAAGDQRHAQDIRRRLNLYEQQQPYRLPPREPAARHSQ